MKTLLYTLCLLAWLPAAAQKGEAYQLTVNGVKVIVQPSGNELVVVKTIVKGGVQNYTAARAGIESLAISALTECGTAKDDKNSFKNKLERVSAQVYGNAGMDFSSLTLNCIRADFDKVWPLYTDALLTPRFDAKEFSRIRQDAINAVRAMESNPDNAISKLARHTAFAGKPYAIDPEGSAAVLANLSPAETKKYWQSVFNRNRLVIVIVGDMDKAVVESRVKALLDKVPAGAPFVARKEAYVPAANTFNPQPRENATNYIQGISSGPQPGTPDYNAFVLAMRIFSSRHFVEIRSKNGLSYAPNAWFNGGNSSYANFFVTTTEPDKYIAVARQLIEKVRQEGFTPEELKNEKTGYVTEFYYRQETNEAQANSLAAAEVVHGNWRRVQQLKEDMKKVSLDDLNRVFRKYVDRITWSYQGDPQKVTPALFTQKETPALPAEKKAF